MIGLDGWDDRTTYELQKIKDNVQLFTPELLDRINQEVMQACHALVSKDQMNDLPQWQEVTYLLLKPMFIFLPNTSQLFDAICKIIEITAKLSLMQGLSQWRQYRHVILSLKRDLQVVQKQIHVSTRDAENKEKANKAIKQAYLNYCSNVDY